MKLECQTRLENAKRVIAHYRSQIEKEQKVIDNMSEAVKASPVGQLSINAINHLTTMVRTLEASCRRLEEEGKDDSN